LAKNTVEKYLDLLSKVFILFKIEGFSRNLRKEITKSRRWYFYDNGIRNGLINNFNRLNIRNDVGDLWENYLASERLKKQHYKKIKTNKKLKMPTAFAKAYLGATFEVVNRKNYLDFIT